MASSRSWKRQKPNCSTVSSTVARLSVQFQNIKGTFDILPDASDSEGTSVPSSSTWKRVEDAIREVMARYDFREIRTPILEPTELIARGVGQLTDIVSKEMFSFERGSTSYVLRPEITAPVMRAYLQHHMDQVGGAQRLYYLGPCFRAERPQKGRYRQFHQFGAEVIGTGLPVADAEVIVLMMDVYAALGITDTELRINTLGDEESRPRYREALVDYFKPYVGELSETSRNRLESNPLRILDTKVPREMELLSEAPRLVDFVDSESLQHYEAVKGLLADAEIGYVEDPMLVRGLDYYARTAFELESPHLGAQSALAGGGRYDLLAVELGSRSPVPAVGFAAGMERLFLALEAAGAMPDGGTGPEVFVVALGEAAMRRSFLLVRDLRSAGVNVAYDLLGRSLKAQMREANRINARWAVIIGEKELNEDSAAVKNMETGEQTAVEIGNIVRFLS